MESNRKLKAFLVLTLIFISVFTFDWYSKINEVRLMVENDDTYVSDLIASQKMGYRYNNTSSYFWRKKVKKTEQNSLVPFVYKTVVLSESKYVFMSQK